MDLMKSKDVKAVFMNGMNAQRLSWGDRMEKKVESGGEALNELKKGLLVSSPLLMARDRAGKVAAQQETRRDETEKAAWCFPLLIVGGSAGDAQGNDAAVGNPPGSGG
ncbi:hypothetical protein Drorol1_Dr00011944 [Drosera rotundifolia]